MNPLLKTPDELSEGSTPSMDGATIDESFAVMAANDVKRKLSSGTITLGLVVVLAAVGLLSMRMITRVVADSSSTVLPKEIEERIKAGEVIIVGADFGEALKLDVYTERRVPLANVSKDPFRLFGEESSAPERVVKDEPRVDPRILAIQQWREEVERVAPGLEATSIMGGGTDNARAILNGKIVRVGHVVGGDRLAMEFTVREITPEAVIVVTINNELNAEQEVEVRVRRAW